MTKQIIHVIGSTGCLGSAFVTFALKNQRTVRCYSSNGCEGTIRLDLSRINSCSSLQSIIEAAKDDIIINFAAVSNPSAVTKDFIRAHSVNVSAASALAGLSRKVGARFCHLSSVEVFNGTQSTYCEEDSCNPLNLYGYLKMMSEESVLRANPDSLVIRTSWNIPVGGIGRCLVAETFNQLKTGKSMMAVDNVFTIASSGETAANMYHLLANRTRGVVHLACSEPMSRAALALYICNEVRQYGTHLQFNPCLFQDLKISIVRGRNNVLDNRRSILEGCYYSDTWDIIRNRIKEVISTGDA